MKKCFYTGKKALAVFMAVLMAMTAMVFVAPQKTAAADEVAEHVHDFHGIETVITPATCTTDGEKTVKCIFCDVTETQVIPKTGHSYVVKESVAPSCTSSGYDVMVCQSDENHKYDRYDASKPAKGHTWSEWKVVTASTNDTAGSMERKCTVDGCDAKETAQIPAGNHVFAKAGKVVKEATCRENGLIEYTCTSHIDADGNNTCGVKITVESGKKAHTYKTDVVVANCHQAGSIITKCAVCGDVLFQETTEKKEHSWSAWTTTKEPTCDKDNGQGLKVRVCELCGDKEEEIIPPLADHDYVKTEVPATCTERGYTFFSCKRCDYWYRDLFTPVLGHDYDKGVYEAPTCTTPGRIKYTCQRVLEGKKCGYFYYDEVEGEPATGHNFSEWYYIDHPTVDDAYAKRRDCTNGGCDFWEYEEGAGEGHQDKDGVNIYYLVNFYNEWVSDGYETIDTNELTQRPVSYTKLTTSYKTEKLASVYVLKGTEAVYPGKTPVREKDRENGEYTFEGWTIKGIDHALAHEPDEYESSEGLLLNLSAIDKNTEAYALFRSKDVYYNVTFYNADGYQLTKTFSIHHGHAVEAMRDVTVTLNENNQYKYVFKGWSYDFEHIYDNVGIVARYEAIKKQYTLVYHDYDGTVLRRETITHGGVANNIPDVTEKPEDETYIYKNLDKWTLVDKTTEVNLSNFTSIPSNAKEGDEIHIYAKQERRFKIYKVRFIVLDPYNQNLSGATVQVLDSRGQLAASVTTDEVGVADVELTYSSIYTLKISRGNYAIEGTFTFDIANPGTIRIAKVMDTDRIYQGTVQLENYTDKDMPVDEKCGCVCHTFLSGIWIFTLNLLYKVFKIRHVCCYDMFVVHGDKLDYTSR